MGMYDLPASPDPDATTAKKNLEIAAKYLAAHGTDNFPTIVGIDKMTLVELQALSARGNLFGASAVALRESGLDLGTSTNAGPLQLSVGEVMEQFGMAGEVGKGEAHSFACYCMAGDSGAKTVLGLHAAASLRRIIACRPY